jgi:DNA polymerase III alpha subunit
VCPLVRFSDGELGCGFDKKDVEEVGLCKLDLLGLSTLDRLHLIEDMVNENH